MFPSSSSGELNPDSLGLLYCKDLRIDKIEKMRLGPLIFSFDYPPLDGGIARLCAEIVRAINGPNKITDSNNLEVLTGADSAKSHAGLLCPPAKEFRIRLRRPWREVHAFFRLLLNRGQISKKDSVCLCGLWYPEGLIAKLAGVKPLVILAHGNELMPVRSWWRGRVWKMLQRWVLEGADLVVANSRYTADLVQRAQPKACVEAIPLAVDHLRFSPGDRDEARRKLDLPKEKLIILTVARLYSYKGFSTLFKALSELEPEQRDQWLFVIAGTGPDKEKLQAEAKILKIEDQVRWLGFVNENDLPSLYRAAHVSVLCTEENIASREVEGFGLALLEAQSSGVPVIGSTAGGIPDAVTEGDGGWMIAPKDVNAMRKLLELFSFSPDVLAIAGAKARLRVLREFTWNHYIQRLERALEKNDLPLLSLKKSREQERQVV